jgi:hypothetical protein
MKPKYIILLCVALSMVMCSKNESRLDTYLNQWMGKYEGTSHHWMTYPGDSGMINSNTDKHVLVHVQKSSLDSCLNFTFTFDDTLINNINDIYFLPTGKHFSDWGGGSGYGSVTIEFEPDRMNYHYFQKCGIPCSSGVDFTIDKKEN